MACEDSASIDCAREIRGIASIANAVAPVCAQRRVAGARWSAARGSRPAPSPARAAPTPRASGGATLATTSASHAPSPSVAPAASNSASGIPAAAPAPGSTHDLVALAGELAHDVGHERDAPLALGRLLGDPDPHGGGNLYEARGDVRRRRRGSRLRAAIAAATPRGPGASAASRRAAPTRGDQRGERPRRGRRHAARPRAPSRLGGLGGRARGSPSARASGAAGAGAAARRRAAPGRAAAPCRRARSAPARSPTPASGVLVRE